MKLHFLIATPIIIAALVLPALIPSRAVALSGSEFNAGRIIDDLVFTNKNSMSVADIQNFLNAKVPTCARWHSAYNAQNPPPYTCLKEYQENTTTGENNFGRYNVNGTAYTVPGGKSAAQIIWDSAQAYNINPQALLVLLQKEQGLVTDDWPLLSQFNKATGYLCPDTAACSASRAGFFKQMDGAGWQFRNDFNGIGAPGDWGAFGKGWNNIRYSPNAACGTKSVYIETQATAVLYKYTPYTPNQSALNNLYGSGDSCGAYGNRNFWRYFRDWFGSTYANDTVAPHPNGTLISEGGKVLLIENGAKRHILSPLIFESYNYKWGKIKTSSIGDASLPFGAPISDLAPSTLIRTDGSPIYIMDYDGTVLKKRHVSYEAFMAFGYRWEDVKYLSSHGMPGLTHPSVLYKDKHPSGSLVVIPGIPKVYLINKGQLHHIVSPLAFESNNYDWSKIKTATSQDALLPIGDSVDTRQGTMVLSNGIFFIDYDVSGILKRPVGPWECYADRFHYNSSDWFNVADPSWLPTRTGSLLTC